MDNYFDTAKNEGYVNGVLFRDHNEWRKAMAATGQSAGGGNGISIPQFNFNWDEAENAAFEKLKPYYEKKLAEANGDVELAKKRIEEDYTTGERYRSEDLGILTTINQRTKDRLAQDYGTVVNRANEDIATSRESDALTAQQETRDTQSDLNRRGVLFGTIRGNESSAPTSEFAQTQVLDPLTKRQQLRKMALERAYNRQLETAGQSKDRGMEDAATSFQQNQNSIARAGETALTTKDRSIVDANTAFDRTKRDMGEEQKQKAIDMANMNYNREYTKYIQALGGAS